MHERGSKSRSSARCNSSYSGPIPFRAATDCATYARPRLAGVELEALREQLRELVAGDARAPGPSTGTSRPATSARITSS